MILSLLIAGRLHCLCETRRLRSRTDASSKTMEDGMTHADNRAYFGYVSKEAARQRQRIAQTHEDETGLAARSAQSEPTLPPKPASRTPTKPEHPRSARIVHSETPSPPRSRFLPKCTVKKWLKCTAYFMNRGFAERSSGRKRTQSEKPCIASFFQTFAAHSPRYARFAPNSARYARLVSGSSRCARCPFGSCRSTRFLSGFPSS